MHVHPSLHPSLPPSIAMLSHPSSRVSCVSGGGTRDPSALGGTSECTHRPQTLTLFAPLPNLAESLLPSIHHPLLLRLGPEHRPSTERTPGTSGEDTGREQNHRMDRSSVCEVCYEAPARYRCPACSRRSCSLACSARHKARSSCPGRRLPSDYRPKPALADPQVLRADFSFLDSVQRSLQSSHDREEDDHERGAARARLAEACQARGVTVCPAPLPSSRARRNQSALVLASARGGQNATSTSTSTSTSTLPDAIANSNEHANADETTAGEQHISWTVDWLLDALPPVTSQLDERVPLQEAFRRDILPSLSLPSLPPNKELKEEEGEEEEFISIKGPARGHDGDTTAYAQEDDNKESTSTASYTFALRLVDDRAAQTSSLRPVSPSATLASALPGTSILEYPTILVSTIPSTTPNTSNTTSASLE